MFTFAVIQGLATVQLVPIPAGWPPLLQIIPLVEAPVLKKGAIKSPAEPRKLGYSLFAVPAS